MSGDNLFYSGSSAMAHPASTDSSRPLWMTAAGPQVPPWRLLQPALPGRGAKAANAATISKGP